MRSQNSEYCFNADGANNCYLVANVVNNENCMYGRDYYDNKDCVDCDHIKQCTLCYQCLNCGNCYNCDYLQDSLNCNDCRYGYFLKGCRDCVGCISLHRKQYYILNKPYTKEEYFVKVAEIKDQLRAAGLYGQMWIPSCFPKQDTVAVWEKM